MTPLIRFGALLCAGAVLAAAGCGQHPDTKNTEAPAPPGIRYEANVSAGGVAPPAVQIMSPHDNAANATAGGNLFTSMNCDGCHGGGATGWVGPSLIDGRWRYGGADEEIFSSIFYGRPKGMPAYGGVVGADGVWMIVAYLKSQAPPSVVPTTSYEQSAQPAAAVPAAAAAPEAPSGPSTPEQMLSKYGCIACHAVDKKVVGPSLKDVAAKYQGHPEVEATLAEKVRNGGSGVWGTIPMAPNPQVPDPELHTLVKWVLALK
jgi:cytochrome c